jgi:flagellar biosynthesis protein FlhB
MEEASEKTEDPSPRRLEEARREGRVVQSRDLVGASVFTVTFATIAQGGGAGLGGVVAYVRTALASAASERSLGAAALAALQALAQALAVPLLAICLAVVVAGAGQTGMLLSFRAVKLDLARAVPAGGRVLSPTALFEAALGVLKLAVLVAACWSALPGLAGVVANLSGASPGAALAALAEATRGLAWRLLLAVGAIAALDFLLRRHQHVRRLRMSREEVRREHRETEGEPAHKAERRRLYQELLEQRMVEEVRKADFVVVNPDHIAVAVRYDRHGQQAPVVVARGERLLAERIKQVARESGVPIFRDVTLARSLRGVQEGDEIPEALYEAVAEILRIVYRASSGADGGPADVKGDEAAVRSQQTPSSTWRRA